MEHREWIGGRIITLLSHYWREDDPVELNAALGKDWADVLEGIPEDAIQKACIQYQRTEPRKKPTPGAIYALARAAMPRPQVVHSQPEPEPAKNRIDAETAQRICEEAGYTPKRFGEQA
ncbi:hypothetical protein JQV19_08490 [Sulfitobacter mediterraneus]|uniref:hypothetical protein n=1 Tax=Sulfitobacter mediterraneus TaxID=83219 RepID=UPI001939D2D8|nr:hypothetical protein [Sulfitobacter mediterraneus]MBM1556684.1 hypothetical protein [Sulfitobacter mediterraneus]MBM1570119.1 hypothetical protein [Sulfitobacter mediterraneus]MBM1574076.1 hypothetical protein [Sulfitobacter mediterraneus]MBM1577861.1 hypothetical protein [Sulfitobacter mediterraneus]MBM1579642.1 hypothetical protein [Sulfitobacter mediterraneus]